jgi:hypothetical protein
MGYADQAALTFIVAFLMTPFGGAGYFFILTIVFWEAFFAWTYTCPYCLSERWAVIICTVFGRVLGEFIWPFLLSAGSGDPIL